MELLERDAVLERIDEALGASRTGSGQALLIDGPAGIGKTSLLTVARGRAQAAGMTVLTARGGELETDFAFGVVRQLFEPALAALGPSSEALFAGAAGLAGPLLGPDAGPPGPSAPQRDAGSGWALVHGLYWLAAGLAGRRPLAVAVDDAHWADAASLEWLVYLVRRLDGVALTLLVTIRSGEPAIPSLRALMRDQGAERLSLEPLSRRASRRIVRSALDEPADEFCAACHAVTGGNPFLLGELLHAVDDAGEAPTAAGAQRVRELAPESISQAVLARLDRLPAPAGALARAAALLGSEAPIRHAAALAGLDESSASAAADALARAQILDGRPLTFVHPVVRSAIDASLPSAARALGHARAARLLAGEGADPMQIGAHLLAAEPATDPDVVALLRRAADEALARAAPETAVRFLRRALSEPVAPDARVDVLADLGRAELLARDPAAIEHLGAAIELTSDVERRLTLTFSLAEVLYYAGRMRDAHALVTHAIDTLGAADESLLAELEAMRAWMGWGWSDPVHAEQTRARQPRLRALAERTGARGRTLSIMVALKLMVDGETPEDALALVRRGLDGGRYIDEETSDATGAVQAAAILTFQDHLPEGERHIEQVLEDSRRRGSVMGYATGLGWRAFAALRRGALPAAETDARLALALLEEHELDYAVPFALEFMVAALLERGQLDECEAALAKVEIEPLAGTLPGAYLLQSRSRLRVAEGRSHAAVADLRRAGATLRALELENPNVAPWRSTLALALAPDAAGEAHELVDVELAWARRAGQARGIGVALRAKGLLTRGADGVSLLEQAANALADCPSKLEQSRALLELGGALRRVNRRSDAREPLRRATELAERCGASVLALRAREELLATGARPRRFVRSGIDSLTPTEHRISAMAARGLSNPEIAQSLFLARKTVENHLGNSYRKLDIRSRGELHHVLSDAPGADGA